MTRLSILLLLFALAACKKDLPNFHCLPNQHAVNYVCVCDTGWFGDSCQYICLPHQHEVNNICICDTGWFGDSCQSVHPDVSGDYHLIGSRDCWNLITGGSSTPVDDTLHVQMIGDSLFIDGQSLTFYMAGDGYYRFKWEGGPSNYYRRANFPVSSPDSLYYTNSGGGLGAGCATKLSGKKIQ